jgi:hypothetical protein
MNFVLQAAQAPPINEPLITDWLTFGIAVLALLLPLLWGGYKQFLRKPKLEIVLSPTATIQYDHRGAGVVLQSMLRAIKGDVFIIRADVRLTHSGNGAVTELKWRVNVQPTVNYQGNIREVPAAPTGFVVPEGSGYSLKAQFSQKDFNPLIAELDDQHIRSWRRFTGGIQVSDEPVVEGARSALQLQIEEFQQQGAPHLTLYGLLQKECPWRAGSYRLTLTLTTADGSTHSQTGEFTLTPEAYQSLYDNAGTMIYSTYNPERKMYLADIALRSKHHE